MLRPATRERQERFIRDIEHAPSQRSIEDYISRRLSRHGLSWLTDEQIADITTDVVDRERFSQRLRISNRAILRRAS